MPEKKKNIFSRSFQELKDPRCLVMTGMFIAMNITMDALNLRIDLPTMRVGVGFLTNASIGMLFGPVVGMMMGFCTDVLGFMLNPGSGGAGYFPGYTLTAIVGGLIWGLFLYRPEGYTFGRWSEGKSIEKLAFPVHALIARVLITLVCNVFMNTLWLSVTGGKAMVVTLISRLPTQLAYLPVQYILLLVVLPIVRQIYRQVARQKRAATY